MYKCLNCQKPIKAEKIKEKIRCPYCGYRIMIKQKGRTIVNVKAR